MNAHILRVVCCLVLSTTFMEPTAAYAVGTHAWMTNEAYLRSKLAVTGPGSIRERLGSISFPTAPSSTHRWFPIARKGTEDPRPLPERRGRHQADLAGPT